VSLAWERRRPLGTPWNHKVHADDHLRQSEIVPRSKFDWRGWLPVWFTALCVVVLWLRLAGWL
jgi:hypothetical protein